jgi:hypothetical protein
MKTATPSPDPAAVAARNMGYLVVGATFVWIFFVTGPVLLAGDKSDTASKLLKDVLPVLGAWVGSVLAFYYGHQSLQATSATVNTLAARLGADASTLATVDKIMIPITEMIFTEVADAAAAGALTIGALAKTIQDGGKGERLPIFTSGRVLHALVYLSTLNTYLATAAGAQPGDTLQQLAASSAALKERLGQFAFVSKNATLAQAQAAMNAWAGCQDVFVSEHGRPDEPVLGWVTNTRLGAALVK